MPTAAQAGAEAATGAGPATHSHAATRVVLPMTAACDPLSALIVSTWPWRLGQTQVMKALEAITNLHTDDVERAREFFRFLGMTELGMNQGWVARFTSADSGACVQVVTRDATAPEDSVMTIKVDDVDAAYAAALQRGYDIVHPVT